MTPPPSAPPLSQRRMGGVSIAKVRGCISLSQSIRFPMPSSPNPFSQDWEKGSYFQVPLPILGEGFRVRVTELRCTRFDKQKSLKPKKNEIKNRDWGERVSIRGTSVNTAKKPHKSRLAVDRDAKTNNAVPKTAPFPQMQFPTPDKCRNRDRERPDRVRHECAIDFPKLATIDFVNSCRYGWLPTRKPRRLIADPKPFATRLVAAIADRARLELRLVRRPHPSRSTTYR